MSLNMLLESFGELLIKKVRDEVLEINDLIIKGKMGGEENLELHNQIKNLNDNQINILKDFARQSVDGVIHYFLWMIEQNEEYDLVKYEEGQEKPISLREISDGLCGELYTENGWIEKYSKYPPSIR